MRSFWLTLSLCSSVPPLPPPVKNAEAAWPAGLPWWCPGSLCYSADVRWLSEHCYLAFTGRTVCFFSLATTRQWLRCSLSSQGQESCLLESAPSSEAVFNVAAAWATNSCICWWDSQVVRVFLHYRSRKILLLVGRELASSAESCRVEQSGLQLYTGTVRCLPRSHL